MKTTLQSALSLGRGRARTRVVAGMLAAVAVAVVAACADDAQVVACKNIPAGGCPTIGNACIDPTCDALYACTTGSVWKFVRDCPPHEDAGTREDSGPTDGGAARDVDIDVPGSSGGPGCGDLQQPDCTLGIAAACPNATSCCGCEDVFVCRNGGWEIWGTCGDGGELTPL